MAADGHDVLTIMMELGHTSPDMATVYVNNRLELKNARSLIKVVADSLPSKAKWMKN